MTDEWAKKSPVNVTEKLKDLKKELDYHQNVVDTGLRCTEELNDMIDRSCERMKWITVEIETMNIANGA